MSFKWKKTTQEDRFHWAISGMRMYAPAGELKDGEFSHQCLQMPMQNDCILFHWFGCILFPLRDHSVLEWMLVSIRCPNTSFFFFFSDFCLVCKFWEICYVLRGMICTIAPQGRAKHFQAAWEDSQQGPESGPASNIDRTPLVDSLEESGAATVKIVWSSKERKTFQSCLGCMQDCTAQNTERPIQHLHVLQCLQLHLHNPPPQNQTNKKKTSKTQNWFEKQLDNPHVLLVDVGDVASVSFQDYVPLFFKIKLDSRIVKVQS